MNRSPWRHFAVLCLITALFFVASGTLMWHAKAPLRVTWNSAFFAGAVGALTPIATFLALAAGISVGTSNVGPRAVRSALGIMVVTVLVMTVIDAWVEPAANLAATHAAKTRGQAWPLPDDTVIYKSSDTLGVIRTAAGLLRDRPAAMFDSVAMPMRQDHPRALAADIAVKLPHFLLPFITIGLILGAATWQRRHVMFRTVGDEIVARWCIAWVLVPAAWAMVVGFSFMEYAIIANQRSLLAPLFVYLPFLVLAALGWRAAAQESDTQLASPSAR